jgi:hypothetical protein
MFQTIKQSIRRRLCNRNCSPEQALDNGQMTQWKYTVYPPFKRWGSVAELTCHLQDSTPSGIRFSHKTYRPSPTKDVTQKDPPLIRGTLIRGYTVGFGYVLYPWYSIRFVIDWPVCSLPLKAGRRSFCHTLYRRTSMSGTKKAQITFPLRQSFPLKVLK